MKKFLFALLIIVLAISSLVTIAANPAPAATLNLAQEVRRPTTATWYAVKVQTLYTMPYYDYYDLKFTFVDNLVGENYALVSDEKAYQKIGKKTYTYRKITLWHCPNPSRGDTGMGPVVWIREEHVRYFIDANALCKN